MTKVSEKYHFPEMAVPLSPVLGVIVPWNLFKIASVEYFYYFV